MLGYLLTVYSYHLYFVNYNFIIGHLIIVESVDVLRAVVIAS